MAMKGLWVDKSIKRVLVRGKGYALYDNLEYFINRIDEVSSESYIPCDGDILRARLLDTGINKEIFDIQGERYQLLDVSGDRSQRRHKWKTVLDQESLDCVVFVASLSGYNSCLLEDTSVVSLAEPSIVKRSVHERRLWLIIILRCRISLMRRSRSSKAS